MFTLEAVDLGPLRTVKVSHDGTKAGAGWFLDRITVKESESGQEKYVFNCDRQVHGIVKYHSDTRLDCVTRWSPCPGKVV